MAFERNLKKITGIALGFTLLEVMVSLAILSVSLVAILNLHSGGVRVHNHAKHLTVATLLARSKMIDIEEYLLDEGLPEFNETMDGSFEEDGYPGYSWSAEIVRAELGLDESTVQGLLGQAVGAMGGGMMGQGDGMSEGIESMFGGIGGMLQGQIQGLLDTLAESVREIRLTVAWEDITGPSQFSIVTHIVRMEGQGVPGGEEDLAREAQRIDLDRVRQQSIDAVRGMQDSKSSVPTIDLDRRLPAFPGGPR